MKWGRFSEENRPRSLLVLTGKAVFVRLNREVGRLGCECGRSSGVERLLAKQKVVGSSPIARSRFSPYFSIVFLNFYFQSAYDVLSFFDIEMSKERQICIYRVRGLLQE